MSLSIKQRVSSIIAGGVHAVLDSVEKQSPLVFLEQKIKELDEVTQEVRHELGKVASQHHLVQQQHASLNQEHCQLNEAIELAVSAKRDDLASAAIGRMLDIESQLPILEQDLADLAQKSSEFSAYIDALASKRREMRLAIDQFVHSQNQSRNSKPPTNLSSPQTLEVEARVDDVEQAFDDIYRRATGTTPLAYQATMNQHSQLQELNQMIRDTAIADRLTQIKQKANL